MKPDLTELVKEEDRKSKKRKLRESREKKEPSKPNHFLALTIAGDKKVAGALEKAIRTYLNEEGIYQIKPHMDYSRNITAAKKLIAKSADRGAIYDAIFIAYTQPADLALVPLMHLRIAILTNTPAQTVLENKSFFANLSHKEIAMLNYTDLSRDQYRIGLFVENRLYNSRHNEEDLAAITNTFLYSGTQAPSCGKGNKGKVPNSRKDSRDNLELRSRLYQRRSYRS